VVDEKHGGGPGLVRRHEAALALAVLEAADLVLSGRHVLVGLASVSDSIPARILADYGLGLADVRAALSEAPR
jgi:hypothetical protein